MLIIFSCDSWPSVCLLWRNAYLGLLSISLFFFILSFISFLYILEINILLVISFASIFSHSVSCHLVLIMVSFAVQKFLSFIGSYLFIFGFIFTYPILLWFMSKFVLPLDSSGSYIVSGLTLKSLIHFSFFFLYDGREIFYFILWHIAVMFSQHCLMKRLLFSFV